MGARNAFHAMLDKRIDPVLRSAGFRRSSGTWRLTAAHGDIAVVNVQKSQWTSTDEVPFFVNLAVLPAAWWEYCSQIFLQGCRVAPLESDGLLRRRLDPPEDRPTPVRGGWQVHDATSAGACGLVLSEQLDRVAIPELRAMLDRDHLFEFIRSGAEGWWVTGKPQLAMAYVIVDRGLRAQLGEILDAFDSAPNSSYDVAQSAWLRRRASLLSRNG
ncbi:DUF4304 domain-containing protein [Planosporangium mesophilum]|uniref:DUF4304 domain-containing protein n=1 Tax=Planosporangium mesophilum TaxID=689768 RepID=A0A8J3TGZ9_9ACTN|nr:DUF4304 domain-containing protein [Planosporangium mesophilum]NJC84320.1 DUF4304 domain-containing protein [Planosporangium mesophilum]GII25592.1 hypothetical protein Pme01_51890 [Planosporangium mesophilum]